MLRKHSIGIGLSAIFKPEYLLRPTQIVRRLQRSLFKIRAERLVAQLPWGWSIQVDPSEDLGKALLHLGVYDLAVSEVLWRLCDEGETTLDLGANIGYMTALLAKRVGSRGRVLCFEANPRIEIELQNNVANWREVVGGAVIQVFGLALSDCEGSVQFQLPLEESHNRGTGRVVEESACDLSTASFISVPSSTLDRCLDGLSTVGVAKMDVEGHEEKVLRGSRQVLQDRRIRDWVFEHHSAYPSEVTKLFEKNGYSIFQIKKGFFRPELLKGSIPIARSTWMPQSFIATLDAARAISRMKCGGWQCLA
ncbi:MAG TPA: FkbM family methyltransferase [Gemmataceae bacterium]|jgi:FkbM family methyltransferase